MFTRMIGRISAAALLALGLLMVTAVPASASATAVDIAASSTIEVRPSTGGAPVAVVHTEPGGTTESPCAPINGQPPTHIPINLNSTTGGTLGAATTGWGLFTAGSNNFKARLNITGGVITLSTTGASVTLTATATFATCDSTATLCTTNAVTMTLSGPSVGHHPTVSTTTTVTGTSGAITTPFSCNSVIRAILNGTHAVASLNLHFTSSTP